MNRRKLIKIGKEISTLDDRRGEITGVFESSEGEFFYQLDGEVDVMNFVSHDDVHKVFHSTTLLKKPKKGTKTKRGLASVPDFEDLPEAPPPPAEWVDEELKPIQEEALAEQVQ